MIQASFLDFPELSSTNVSQNGDFLNQFSDPKISPFFGLLFQATKRVTHSCSSFSLNVAKIMNIGPKIVVVSIRSTQTKNARKASKMRATLRMTSQMSKKGATRRLRQHTCIAPAKCSKIGLWSGPWGIGGCVPDWPPRGSKIGPPHRPKPDPTEPENRKTAAKKRDSF